MSEVLQLGHDLHEQTYSDESPNRLTAQDQRELRDKYSESSDNIKAWSKIGIKRFKESLGLSEQQIKTIQGIIGARQTGVFDGPSFYKYAVYINGRDRTLKSILREASGGSSSRSTVRTSGRRGIETESNGVIAYPPRSKSHAREMQQLLKQEGYYTKRIDGDFGHGSRMALQKLLQSKGLYNGRIDGVIGGGTQRAIDAYNSGAPSTSTRTTRSRPDRRRDSAPESERNLLNTQELREAAKYIKDNLSNPEIKELRKKLRLRRNASLGSIAQAVAQYQSQNGLIVDGKPGNSTLASLGVYKGTMYGSGIDRSNATIRRAERLRGFEKLSQKWKVIFAEFFQVASQRERNEILSGKYPIALADTRTRRGLIIMGNKHIEFPVSFSKNGRFVKGPSQGDNAVNYGFVEHFTHGRPYKYGGMAVEVREAQQVLPGRPEPSYKWWHAAAGSNRDGLRDTIGCKGLPTNIAQQLANYVNKTGKGFGYTSRR